MSRTKIGKRSQRFSRKMQPLGNDNQYDKSGYLQEPGEYGSRYRAYGSTHGSATKDRIVRTGKKGARQQVKNSLKNYTEEDQPE